MNWYTLCTLSVLTELIIFREAHILKLSVACVVLLFLNLERIGKHRLVTRGNFSNYSRAAREADI